ncbi:uncharacterized protein LOC121749370 [Salvia splendens]|uniref:uncharacterized protein LOC121749370 n=1 Tax=Salvia splendens TaxID=180675 RepID=UPI001C26F406|nr:uncharacterized protein LOC121749370 [Salvia splendens]
MVSYVPPNQRGYQNSNQTTQSQQHGSQGPHGNFHQGQGYASNHPPGVNPSQPNSKLSKHIDGVVRDLMNSQQHIQGNMQANNDLVHRIQDAQQEEKATMDMLTKQLSQMATMLNEIRGHDGRIPATVKMPDREEDGKENIEGTLLKEARGPFPQFAEPQPLDREPEELSEEIKKHERDDPYEGISNAVNRIKPCPYRGEPKRQKKDPTDFMEIFGKLEINLPFLQALKLPSFNRFIKDFIAGKAKVDGKIVIGESVSVVIQKKRLPSKRTDPGMFTLPISIGDIKIEHAMCDLGVSINVLPFSVYKRITGVSLVIQRLSFSWRTDHALVLKEYWRM